MKNDAKTVEYQEAAIKPSTTSTMMEGFANPALKTEVTQLKEAKYLMSNDSPDLEDNELPVAAKVNVYKEPTTEDPRTQFLEVDDVALDHKDDLVRVSDAEEAIRQREQKVRREILDKIEDIWHSFTPKELPRNDLNGARKMKKEIEEELCEDLESSKHSADSSGNLQQEEAREE
jgi:hypothetical protein